MKRRVLSLVAVLAALSLMLMGCGKAAEESKESSVAEVSTESVSSEESTVESTGEESVEEVSSESEEAARNITIEVVGKDGQSVSYEVKTDAEFLRGAMEAAEGLTFSGTEGEWGMMVDTVNDEVADYVPVSIKGPIKRESADRSYWNEVLNRAHINVVCESNCYSLVRQPEFIHIVCEIQKIFGTRYFHDEPLCV